MHLCMYLVLIRDVHFASRIHYCLPCCQDELLELHRGQGMDIHWRDAVVCPSEYEYLDMIGKSRA